MITFPHRWSARFLRKFLVWAATPWIAATAIQSHAGVFTWGRDSAGQLGINEPVREFSPVQTVQTGALAGKTIVAAATGGTFTMVLASDGMVFTWGNNLSGQLGNGSNHPSAEPLAITAGSLAGKTVTAIAAGFEHCLALASDGTLHAWGMGAFGQLGHGSTLNSSVPVLVSGGALAGKTVTKIACGNYHSLALTADNVLVAWGQNSSGAVGDGATTQRNSPVLVNMTGVLSGLTIQSIYCGASHSLVLSSSGAAYSWGSNSNGQLGDGSLTQRTTAVAVVTSGVLSGKTLTSLAAGALHTLALSQDGLLFSWGNNGSGSLGTGTTGGTQSSPVAVSMSGALAGRTPTAIATSNFASTVRTSDGLLFSWGQNDVGQVGDGTTNLRTSAIAVSTAGVLAGKTVTALSTSCGMAGHVMAITSDGLLVGWGLNSYAQIGTGVTKWKGTPVAPSGVTGTIVAVAAGGEHSLFLTSSGNLYAMGANQFGQLGIGSTTNFNRATPGLAASTISLGGKTLSQISSGFYHNAAVTTDGTVYTWGYYSSGQLGDGSSSTRYTPASISGSGLLQGKVITSVACGYGFTLALASDGKVYAWGDNSYGQLGDGTTTQRSTPVAVDMSGALAGKTVIAIAAGSYHSVVCTSDGGTYAWGFGLMGQMGDGTATSRSTPGQVSSTGVLSGKTIVKVGCGDYSSFAISSDGLLYSWGVNSYGQLGDGSTSTRNSPVAVSTSGVLSGKSVANVSSGAGHTVIITTDGQVFSAGRNVYGTLGNGAASNSSVPVAVDTTSLPVGSQASQVACARSGYHTIIAASSPQPDIAIEQPAATNLVDGSATVAFGAAAVTTTVDRIFTLRNMGDASLTGIAATLGGSGVANFSVESAPPSSLAPGGSATFTIRYTAPGSQASSSATLQVTSNDTDESPFDIQLTGSSYVPVTITSEPQDVTTASGNTVTFTVAATGTGPLSYQWRKHGSNISGATSATYSISNVSGLNEDTYDVVVSNSYSSDISRSATLAVATIPVITSQPYSLTANPGDTATLSVNVTGTGLSYQWFKYYNVALAGQTSATLSLSNVTNADEGWYYLRVTNVVGTIYSALINVVVNDPITIAYQPSGYAVNPGQAIYLWVSADGDSPSFQWRKNGIDIPGAVYDYLYITSALESDQGNYDVVVSNSLNSVTSETAVVSVNDPVSITSQPVSATIDPGSAVTFTASATGTGPLTYQWFRNNVALTTNAASNSYTVTSASAANSGYYKVVITNVVSSVTSNTVSLNLRVAPSIISQPVGQAVAVGSSVSLSVVATGSGPLSYQWLKNDAPMSGQTNPTLTLGSVATTDSATYKVTVANSVSTVTSSAAVVQVIAGIPLITTQPAHTLAALGGNVVLSVSALGAPPLKYQWRKNGIAIAGATTASLMMNNVQNANAGAYSVVVTSVNSTISQTAYLGVVTVASKVVTATDGTSATMSISAVGQNLEYIWLRDDVPLNLSSRFALSSGGLVFTIKPLQSTDTASYRCLVKGPGGTSLLGGITSLRVITSPPVIPEDTTMGPYVIGSLVNFTIPTDPAPERSATSYDAVGLPPGLIVNKTTGLISGRPSTWRALPYQVTLIAKNIRGTSSLVVGVSIAPLPEGMKGNYDGLIDRSLAFNKNLGGSLRISLASNGYFTGTLRVGKDAYPVSGYFDTNAETGISQASVTIRQILPEPIVTLHLTIQPGTSNLSASLVYPTGSLSAVAAHCPWSTLLAAPSSLTGTYNTFYAPGVLSTDVTYPQGFGYTIITIKADGTASWRGYLSDGTAITGSTLLGANGGVALRALLYGNAGSFQGLHFVGSDQCNGNVSWFKNATPTSLSYKAGIPLHGLTILGGRYSKANDGTIVLGLATPPPDNAVVRFEQGGFATTVLQPVQIPNTHKVTWPSGLVAPLQGLAVTILPTTGELSGSFSLIDANPLDITPPISTLVRTTSFRGLLITRSDVTAGVGYFNMAKLPQVAGESLTNTQRLSGKIALLRTQ